GKGGAHLGGEWRAVWLVQAVVERCREELSGTGCQGGAEERRAAGVERGVGVGDGGGGYGARRLPVDLRPRDQRGRGGRGRAGDARDPGSPGEARAAGERGGEVVAVALELDPMREQRLRVGLVAVGERRRDETQRRHRRTGPEAARARDPVGEG